MNNKCRELTREEIQKEFLGLICHYINYWERLDSSRRECLEGLAFSILVILDGESCLPAFNVIPAPHEDDKKFRQDESENWYPNDVDIAGGLHELFSEKYRTK